MPALAPTICADCGADLLARPHDARCLSLTRQPWRITRLAMNEADRMAEDALQEATRKAWVAAERNGGRP